GCPGCGLRLYDGYVGPAPVVMRIVHHDVDEDRQETVQNGGTVANLVPVHLAFPGGAAVYQLVAQHVEPVEEYREDQRRVAAMERSADHLHAAAETFLPILVTRDTVLVFPERRIDIPVVQEKPDLLREPVPHGVVDPVVAIK